MAGSALEDPAFFAGKRAVRQPNPSVIGGGASWIGEGGVELNCEPALRVVCISCEEWAACPRTSPPLGDQEKIPGRPAGVFHGAEAERSTVEAHSDIGGTGSDSLWSVNPLPPESAAADGT